MASFDNLRVVFRVFSRLFSIVLVVVRVLSSRSLEAWSRCRLSTSLLFLKYRHGRRFPGSEMHENRTERSPGNRVDGVATPSRGPPAFAWRFSHDAVSSYPSGIWFCPASDWWELWPPSHPVACRREWGRQFHFFLASPSTPLLLSRRRNTLSLSRRGLSASKWAQNLDWRHTIRRSCQDYSARSTFHLGRWWRESVGCWWRDRTTKCKCQRSSSAAPVWGHD